MTGQCKFDGTGMKWSSAEPNLFCFFLPPAKKEEGNPTHIAHNLSRFIGIAKAPQLVPSLREANATTKALPKSAILPTHPCKFVTFEL
jgi:hypothetical protein